MTTLSGIAEAASGVAGETQKTLLLLAAAILVLVMTLGIWLFYSAMAARLRDLLLCAVLVVVLWALCCYGFVFGPVLIPGFLGNPLGFLASGGLATGGGAELLHGIAFATFQCTVAILTVTIVFCAVGKRVERASSWVFVGLWMILGYSPIAYSVLNMADGWLFDGLEINDQAGGTVVHISAGAAALALLVVLGRVERAVPPAAQARMLGGAALVWIGAFGLNVGSEGVVDTLFGTILVNTLIAPAVALIAWVIVEMLMTGRPTLQGAASGVVAGIVAITSACNILTPAWTVLLGLLAGAIGAVIVSLARGRRLGEGFGVVGIHLVVGILGLGYIGILGNGIGWKDTGQPDGIADQTGAALGVAAWSFAIAFVIAWLLRSRLRLGSRGSEAPESLPSTR